jgi:hypothetical protein
VSGARRDGEAPVPGTDKRRRDGLEETELRALVCQAWELRKSGSPYVLDACAAIVEWHERRHLRRLERDQAQAARLARLPTEPT